MTELKSEMLDVYIDESHVTINGNPSLIYGIVIPKDLEQAIRDLVEIKGNFNLGKEVELKWSWKHEDAKLKAEVKDEIIHRLAWNFQCLVNVNKGRDKDTAFVNALKQVCLYARANDKKFINIFYDRDAFINSQAIKTEIESWDDLYCTTIASLDSQYSIPIQFADMLAGTFNYVINVAFGKPPKQVKIEEEGYDDWEIDLDHLFRIVLRYSMWGQYPNRDEEDFGSVQEAMDCYGTGIVIDGDFSEEEMKVLRELCWFYQGCLH